jgi:HSP20 family protein
MYDPPHRVVHDWFRTTAASEAVNCGQFRASACERRVKREMVPDRRGTGSRPALRARREMAARGDIAIGTVIAAARTTTAKENGMRARNKPSPPASIDLSAALDGVIDGLGRLLRQASDLADQPGGASGKKLHAVYGISVRVGGLGPPVAARFGNVRQERPDAPVVGDTHEPMADIIDEEDHYLIVVELPGVDQAALRWEIDPDGGVTIRAESRHRKYFRRLTLNAPVERDSASSSYSNGVLELKLWKQRRS